MDMVSYAAMRMIDDGMHHRVLRMGGGAMMRRQHHRGGMSPARCMVIGHMAYRRRGRDQRAKREPVKIEPPAAPVVEKSERAKREQQIPLFHGTGGDPSGLPPLALLDDPKPQPKGYDDEPAPYLY